MAPAKDQRMRTMQEQQTRRRDDENERRMIGK